MYPTDLSSFIRFPLAPFLRRFEYLSLLWENEILPDADLAAVEGRTARAFAGRGAVISPWHGGMAEARAAIAAGRVTPLEGTFEINFGPGITKPVRLLLTEPPGRQPILFLAIDGFFAGVKSPYDTPQLAADTLAFALAVDALLAAAVPARGAFIWATDWETAPAMLLLGARHITAFHLHHAYDRWLGDVLPHFAFPRADALAHTTALRAAMLAADVVAGVNPGFVQALHDPAWPIYPAVLVPHLQDVCDRMVAVTNGPFAEMRAEWSELLHACEPDTHAAGKIHSQWVGEQRKTVLPLALRRVIQGRMILLVGGRSVTQKLPEVAIAAARRVLTAGNFRGFFVFALLPGDEFSGQRRAAIHALRDEFPQDVLVVEDDPAQLAALLAVANAQIFGSAWEPHGPVFHGPTLPIAFGEGPCAQIKSWSARGRGAQLQARFHRADEPRNGWWLYPQVVQRPELTVENWRALAVAPPSADNKVFCAMVDELALALRHATRCWSADPVAFAAVVRAALRRQVGRSWAGADSYGRMFELIAAVPGQPRRAA